MTIESVLEFDSHIHRVKHSKLNGLQTPWLHAYLFCGGSMLYYLQTTRSPSCTMHKPHY